MRDMIQLKNRLHALAKAAADIADSADAIHSYAQMALAAARRGTSTMAGEASAHIDTLSSLIVCEAHSATDIMQEIVALEASPERQTKQLS